MSSVWLAWCYVQSSPAGMERARRAEQIELERLESARRTAADSPVATPALEAPRADERRPERELDLSPGLPIAARG